MGEGTRESQVKWEHYLNIFSKDLLPLAYENRSVTHDIVALFLQHFTNIKFMLDVGCGTGTVMKLMKTSKLDIKPHGVTLMPQEKRLCEKNGLAVKYADYHALPYKNGIFDAVFCKDAFQYSLSPPIALAEMNRVLKPKGYIFIANPDSTWVKDKQHFVYLTHDDELRYLCKWCGFKEILFLKQKMRGQKFAYLIYTGRKERNL